MAGRTLAERLRAARARSFVGRATELELFGQSLASDTPPFSLIWVHGPGGIGKSTLLQRMADEAEAAGAVAVLMDARTVEVTPPGVRAAVEAAIPSPSSSAGSQARLVLLLDTAELLLPVDDWLRTIFLPELPAGAQVVLASRHPPGQRWRADLGWAQEMRVLALPPLDPPAATALLAARGVPGPRREAAIAAAHGHPLALALVAEVLAAGAPADPPADPSVVVRSPGERTVRSLIEDDAAEVLPALLERFMDDVPDPARRSALQVLGHARVTTEPLLRAIVGEETAADLFDWLRGLSFVQPWTGGRVHGLIPHDLARDVLDTDLRLRDPGRWSDLHRAIRAHHVQQLTTTTGVRQARAVADLLWFARNSPALAAYRSWDASFRLWTEPARDADRPAVLELVHAHEGMESVALHQFWWEHQPEAFFAVRDRPGALHGFVVQLRLDASTAGLVAESGDPFARTAWEHVARRAPLRAGQHLRLLRSWIGTDGYHLPTPTQQAITGLLTRLWLAEPGLAASVAYSPEIDLWTAIYAHIDYAHAADADVRLVVTPAGAEGRPRRFGAFVHDWRITSPTAWLELLEQRELRQGDATSQEALVAARRHLEAGTASLDEAAFATAVKQALRTLGHPNELAGNELLMHSALLRGEPTPQRLRDVLTAAVQELATRPRGEKLSRVLVVTYLKPAATQEAAAARLSLPFSTYRRHLGLAVQELTAALWDAELAASV